MKITRNINGVEVKFELTYAELMEAHREYWRDCLKDDLISRIDEHTDDVPNDEEVWLNGFGDVKAGVLRSLLTDDDNLIRMAERFDNALAENFCISDCHWQTADNILGEMCEEVEE